MVLDLVLLESELPFDLKQILPCDYKYQVEKTKHTLIIIYQRRHRIELRQFITQILFYGGMI